MKTIFCSLLIAASFVSVQASAAEKTCNTKATLTCSSEEVDASGKVTLGSSSSTHFELVVDNDGIEDSANCVAFAFLKDPKANMSFNVTLNEDNLLYGQVFQGNDMKNRVSMTLVPNKEASLEVYPDKATGVTVLSYTCVLK